MTAIEYTRNHVTQKELARAYQRLGHTSTAPDWAATLLIDVGLTMSWACPVLHPPELRTEHSNGHSWHVIAEAGELDWPPLRPESEIWPKLLAKDPVPTGEWAEKQARFLGKSIEQMHHDRLRAHYLSSAHIPGPGGNSTASKRNPTDVNFDPIVRDWDATARELAHFLDTHRPPKLTAEQRVMAQGVHLAELEAAVANTKASLGRLMRNAAGDQGDRARRGFKSDMSRWGGVSRPTVDAWLSDDGEGDVPDEVMFSSGTTG
ncbi:hypothetical protein WB401_13390 [Streptomyces brasiliscabiei]|uniref:Uncharacterized protein n=1 Tax=Streptomyces brasiliscabiei TaxID=2736302 RepID=A0ABU8GKV0_9ACTN